MQNIPTSMRWTTYDEILFIRKLHEKGKLSHLQNYVKTAMVRKWYGPGMVVNPDLVIAAAHDHILDLIEAKLRQEEKEKMAS